MTLTVKHASLTGAAANPDVLVDGPKWDAEHTITGGVDAAQMPALTGDVTTSAGAVATTLATVNSNVGTFGSATQSTQYTVNAKGLMTASANVTITPAIGSVTGLGTGVATLLGTFSSANLRAALTDEVGTGAAYFVGGALGTPASGTLTSCTAFTLTTTGSSGAATYSAGTLNIPQYSGGGVTSLNGQTGAVLIAFETKARVTLTSGVAVTESDVTGASSVYVTPAGHNYSMVYDGTNDVPKSYSEITITLDAANALSGKNYDAFLAVSGGVVVAGYGPAWSTDTTRGTGAGTTEIEVYNGRVVNKNSITLRNAVGTTYSIAARQANLVGGFRASANGLTEDSKTKRFVWSVNATLRAGSVTDATTTWTYSTAAYRQANGSAANQIEYLQGLGGPVVKAYAYSVAFNSTSTVRGCNSGIGIDSTTVNGATLIGFGHVDSNSRPMISTYEGSPGLGYHKLVWLEQGAGTDTQTWYGTSTTVIKTGMTAEFVM